MWLFTREEFYEAVRMQDGRVTVQARLRQDLEALRNVTSVAR
jgi:hypothetical protein